MEEKVAVLKVEEERKNQLLLAAARKEIRAELDTKYFNKFMEKRRNVQVQLAAKFKIHDAELNAKKSEIAELCTAKRQLERELGAARMTPNEERKRMRIVERNIGEMRRTHSKRKEEVMKLQLQILELENKSNDRMLRLSNVELTNVRVNEGKIQQFVLN